MKTFEALIQEAEQADVQGWGFEWLDGKATEERPPWGYSQLLKQRLNSVNCALDLDTGGGELLNEMPHFPKEMYATEAWPPNIEKAKSLLAAKGVHIIDTSNTKNLPFADNSFELISSRHPVLPNWPEIYRVLKPKGCYFAQHVGPASAFELIEYFLGPKIKERTFRQPQNEIREAQLAGLKIINLQTARCKMVFLDISAIVWILRKCVWWVPDFSVEKYQQKLIILDKQMRSGNPFIAYSTRHLIEARRE